MTNIEGKFMMPTFKSILLAGTIAMLPLGAQAYAAPKEAPVAEAVAVPEVSIADPDETTTDDFDSEAYAAEAKAKMQKEMDEAIALVEKMFDTSSLPPIEPARLTLAQKTMSALVPAGSLEKMIDNLYGKMFKTIMGEFGGQSDLMLSIKTGVESDKIATLDEATKAKVADLFDPHRKEREDQITKVIKPLISEVLGDMEPPMREGLAKAYARKFTAAQLTDLNGFLATPTGALYANEWMALQADPEVMVSVIKAVPPLITKFMDRGPQIEKDMKDLPKEKQLSDFNDKELAKLAKLMKVSVKELKEHRDQWDTPAEDTEATEAVDAAADAADAAATDVASDAAMAATDAVEDPAYDRDTWSEADRTRVEQLEEAASAASAASDDALEQAVANARDKNGKNKNKKTIN